jgi:hypothetical protein
MLLCGLIFCQLGHPRKSALPSLPSLHIFKLKKIPYLIYSPDFVLNDLGMFLKVKPMIKGLRFGILNHVQWLIPVIPATWDSEIRIEIQGQPWQKLSKTPPQEISWVW